MNVLVLTYWSYKEPLVQAATLNYLKEIRKILGPDSTLYLFTMEKRHLALTAEERAGIEKELNQEGIVLVSRNYHPFGVRAALAWPVNVLWLRQFCKKHSIGALHARGSTAGMTAHYVSKLTGIRYVVDGFEPHADSMVENGTWKKNSLPYKILLHAERLQAKNATAVLAVSSRMHEYAANAYGHIPGNLYLRPGCVDLQLFNPNVDHLRSQLGLEGKLVCVYAGKLGGIYLKREVFTFFKSCVARYGDRFRALLLSDHSPAMVQKMAIEVGIPEGVIIHLQAEHKAVPSYLASADFALNPVKPVPSKRYCTSIKDGEYWAMGLPVVIPEGIADDAELVADHQAGALWNSFDEKGNQEVLNKIDTLLALPVEERKTNIRRLAEEKRHIRIAAEAYNNLYGENGVMQTEPKVFTALIYNSLKDPLFQNLVFSYLQKQLQENPSYQLHLITFEQEKYKLSQVQLRHEKISLSGQRITWHPLSYHGGAFLMVKKAVDLISAFGLVLRLHIWRKPAMFVAFANTSAVITYVIARLLKAPMMIYSYEPHSEFLREFGFWKSTDFKYKLMTRLELQAGMYAKSVLTGTKYMVEDLQKRGHKHVFRAPSSVDEKVFYFDQIARDRIRHQLGLTNRQVMVYVGKFGGIYYEREIGDFFARLHELDPTFFLLIVSPQPADAIATVLQQAGVQPNSFLITEAHSPDEIRGFNSAADIGLTAVPPYSGQRYRSPVKVGEYLLCGLPYITMAGVSEDDLVATEYNVGIVLHELSTQSADTFLTSWNHLKADQISLRERCRTAGMTYRGRKQVDDLFSRIMREA
ncbi:MAG: hypothetical protein RL226_989 [Bacteroidota bacterium]